MIGADTSFLVALAIREHPSHRRAWKLFQDEIVGRTATLALAPQALGEFCHVVTDPRRFEAPLEMAEALDVCEHWWNAEEARPVALDAEGAQLFLEWTRAHRLGRKRLLDTLLAAAYASAGVRRLATTDWRDFAAYGVFDIERI